MEAAEDISPQFENMRLFQGLSVPTTEPATLRQRVCEVCDTHVGLQRCASCEVVYYCSNPEHQLSHSKSHAKACKSVARAREHLRLERRHMPNLRGDYQTDLPRPFATPIGATLPAVENGTVPPLLVQSREPYNPFADGVGHFWDHEGTRGWMLARYVLVDTLLPRFPNHRAAVEEALEHLLDMCRLTSHSDKMGLRPIVPALLVRLGREQEAYDFMKNWAVAEGHKEREGQDQDDAPQLMENADPLKEPSDWERQGSSISHAAVVTLIKIRVLGDVLALQGSFPGLRARFPREISNQIADRYPWSSLVAGRNDLMSAPAEELSAIIVSLRGHIETLVAAVHRANIYFWGALYDAVLDPAAVIDRPVSPLRGSVDEAELMARYNFRAWRETPGAIDVLHDLEGMFYIYTPR